MAVCDACGNDYDKSFTLTKGGKTWTFDSFECAIHVAAPHCARCDIPIIGHGVEQNGTMYCCAHCAKHEGITELKDRAD